MTHSNDVAELHDLLCELVDQRITDQQYRRLQDVLKSSAESRQYYLNFIDMHLGIAKLERKEPTVDPIADTTFEGKWVGASDSPLPASRSFWWDFPVVRIAVAAAVVVAATLAVWQVTEPASLTKAVVESQKGAKIARPRDEVVLASAVRASFFGELSPSLNEAMFTNHQYALTGGMIELRFPSGATTIIEAPAVFTIANVSRLKLQAGNCSVHAPDGAEGFQVETPLTSIVDRGTRFSVIVDETGGTDVQVIEGMADVFSTTAASKGFDHPLRLTERQARIYSDPDGVVSQPKDFDGTRYRHQLPDRVISYKATDPNGRGAVELTDLSVQRGGKIYRYGIERLIGMTLTHYKSAIGKNPSPIAFGLNEERSSLEQIIADRALNTGIINPGGAIEPLRTAPVMASPESIDHPNTPGMAVLFEQPIVNDLGPDIVLFDLQTYTNPLAGDAFHVGPVSFEPGLRTHTLRVFDITMNSKEAKVLERFGLMRFSQPVNSIDQLNSIESVVSRVHTDFRALAVGIDLSDLGYAIGDRVDRLFIQDALDDNDSFVDPALIVGLPPLEKQAN